MLAPIHEAMAREVLALMQFANSSEPRPHGGRSARYRTESGSDRMLALNLGPQAFLRLRLSIASWMYHPVATALGSV